MSLRSKAFQGVRWSGLATAANLVVTVLQSAVLARLLAPDDFGLMGMSLVVVGFANAFADGGVSEAIVQRQDVTRAQLSSLYWFNVLCGVAVFGLVWAATPLASRFYHEPRLEGVLRWTALTFLVTPFGQQFNALLRKELRFDAVAKVQIATSACVFAVSVGAAVAGEGVLALVWGQLAGAALGALLYGAAGWRQWRPALRLRAGDVRGLLRFGLYQMGERCTNFFSANVDYLLVGRYLGADVLGVYTLAYRLVVLPLSRINPLLSRVAFPVFSKKQDDDAALRTGYLEITRTLAVFLFPVLVGLAVVAPVLIPLLYGPGWELAIPLVQLLAVLGMLKTLANPSGAVLLAKGRADLGFKWNVLVAAVNAGALWAAVRFGLFAMAATYVGLCVVYFRVGHYVLIQRLIDLGWRAYARPLRGPLLAALVMGAGVFGCRLLLAPWLPPGLPLLGVLVAIGALLYAPLVGRSERAYLARLSEALARTPRGRD